MSTVPYAKHKDSALHRSKDLAVSPLELPLELFPKGISYLSTRSVSARTSADAQRRTFKRLNI